MMKSENAQSGKTSLDLKERAVHFLQLVTAGKIDEAYQKYVNMDGKHHNLFTPAGLPALRQGMKDNEAQFPHKQFSVKQVIGDGDRVAVYSHLKFRPEDPGMVVIHWFRFDEGGKIVEFWDCGQAIPADSPNKDGAF